MSFKNFVYRSIVDHWPPLPRTSSQLLTLDLNKILSNLKSVKLAPVCIAEITDGRFEFRCRLNKFTFRIKGGRKINFKKKFRFDAIIYGSTNICRVKEEASF